MSEIHDLIAHADLLLQRLERLLPDRSSDSDWASPAYRWRVRGGNGWLQPVPEPHRIQLGDLVCLEPQMQEVERNTRQFLAGLGANNVLLWGSRGTGKSSLVKAVFNALWDQGLRLIEVDKGDLGDLPDIIDLVRSRPERFLLYCDDLSFEPGESGYTALKAALEGSIAAPPPNLLIYATSNRRHLLPELHSDNREARVVDGELHHGESVEEKISLSDRFGLWIPFHPFTQAQYLNVVRHWIVRLGCSPADADWQALEHAALQWALRRGSRSGRTAWQFARDWSGRCA